MPEPNEPNKVKRKGSRFLSKLKRRSVSGEKNKSGGDAAHEEGFRESPPSSNSTSTTKSYKQTDQTSKKSSLKSLRSSKKSEQSLHSNQSVKSNSTKNTNDDLFCSAVQEHDNEDTRNQENEGESLNMSKQNTISILESIRLAGLESPKEVESLEYSPLTQEYVGKARVKKGASAAQHSYDTRFSTTALSQLVAKGIRPTSLHSAGRIGSSRKRLDATSVVWRVKSTNFADNEPELPVKSKSSVGFERPVVTEGWTSTNTVDSSSDLSSDDGILRIGLASQVDKPVMDIRQDDPWYTERTFLGGQGEQGDDIHVGEMIVKNKFTEFVDWALGWSNNEDDQDNETRIRQRDDQNSSDLAWCLGMITGLI